MLGKKFRICQEQESCSPHMRNPLSELSMVAVYEQEVVFQLGPFYKLCRAAPNHRNLSSTEVRLGAPLLFYKNKTFAVLCCAEP